MSQIRIRVNEAELMKVWPRDAVVALRKIITVVSSGIEVGNIGDLDSLILTTPEAQRQADAVRADVERLRAEVAALRQQRAAPMLDGLPAVSIRLAPPAAQDAPASQPNLTDILRRLSDLESIIHGAR